MVTVTLDDKSLAEFGLLPVEIHYAETEQLAERTVVRALQDVLDQRGAGAWVITVILPTGRSVTIRCRTEAGERFDLDMLLGKIKATNAKSAAGVLPRIEKVGPPERKGFRGIAQHVLHDFDWGSLPVNVGGLMLAKSIGRTRLAGFDFAHPTTGYVPEFSLRRPEAQLLFFRGSVLAGQVKELNTSDIKIQDVADGKIIKDPTEQLLIVQLLRPDSSPRNILLPPGATMKLSRLQYPDSAAVSVAISFGDNLADQAVQLRAGTFLSELTAVGTSLTVEEIRDLGRRPAGAAICLLYLLLRTRDPETVRMAVRSVTEGGGANSSDVAVIEAELAARAGDYAAALRGFLEATERGLPYFGQGVTTIADRLELFERMTRPINTDFRSPAAASWTDADQRAIHAALRKIEPFSANCDYSAPVTTYRGIEPTKPGPTRLSREQFLGITSFPIASL
jgi:hypothetical protein